MEAHGLRPPEKILLPQFTPHRGGKVKVSTRVVELSGDASLRITSWPDARTVYLTVQCESMPHCHSCECGGDHSICLPEGKVAEIIQALS